MMQRPFLSRVGGLPHIVRILALALAFGLSIPAYAANHLVSSESDLRTAITSAVDDDTITFNADVTLTQDLPAIQANVTILGNNRTLDGAGTFRGFFVGKFGVVLPFHLPVAVTIQDLTIQNARAQGGAGQDNGGGGAGLGGAIFVANLATVTVSNLQFDANSARGGLGGVAGIYGGGGGGGLGGIAGGNNGGGGGGVGASAGGGNGTVGEGGSEGIVVGASSGGDGAGSGFGPGGSNGGGGGGGGQTTGFHYGGGGGGGIPGFPGLTNGNGGNGGFGGGGGGAGDTSNSGGRGGYGGGGGASGMAGGTPTGLGGFGGGGAGGAIGGFGGGNGAVSIGFPGGGGGAGLGGGLFAQEGGTLILAGSLTIAGSTVAGGGVRDPAASPGSAFGSGIFLQGNGQPLTSMPGAGETQTIADDIADQAGSGSTGIRALTKSGAGTLILSGINTYTGATTVNAGTLLVNSPGSIASPVMVNSGGTLGGTGTVNNTVTVNSGGAIAPGTSPGILDSGALTLNAGSTLTVEINGATVGTQYDQVNVTGSVTLGDATLNVVPGFTPDAGQTFTIIANDLADAVAGTFSGLPEGSSFTAGAAQMRISYVGGSGNHVTLTAIGPPTIAKTFGTLGILVDGTTTLTFTLTNPNPALALTGVAFTDPLPAGLVVANPNGLVSNCGGTVTADAGSGSIELADGSLPAGASCAITVNITGTTGGLKGNITSAIISTEGGTGDSAVAFLVVVDPPDVAPPTIEKAFGAASIMVNGTTTLTVTLTNLNPQSALSGVGFTDTLPAGTVVANPNGLANTCGGTVTATAGTGSLALLGGVLAANTSCTITVNITATTGGFKINTTSPVTSTEGGTGGTASASLTVIAPPTITKTFGAASIALNETTTLTFTVANPVDNGATLTGIGFTDNLPAGLLVATPNGLSGACGGGTITATAGGASIGLSGAALSIGASCAFTVDVQGVAEGVQVNLTSPVTSTEGGAGNTATATIAVAPGNVEFTVTKEFDDLNTAEVEVHLSCNRGLPLEQSFTLAPDYVDEFNNQVSFILTSLTESSADCTVSETPVPGYEPEYVDLSGTGEVDEEGCHYSDVVAGDSVACRVINHVAPVPVTIEKAWEGVEDSLLAYSSIALDCSNVVAGSQTSWNWLSSSADGGDEFVAQVTPVWDGSTSCTVSESNTNSAVEVSGCEAPISVDVGQARAGCTLTNTVFYEGIPAFNRFGLALLALLMLGISFIAVRRFA